MQSGGRIDTSEVGISHVLEDDSELAAGSRHVLQFRSPVEFAPHAAWLLTDPLLIPANCECKYCSKRTGRLQDTRVRSVSTKPPAPTSAEARARIISPLFSVSPARPPARSDAGSTSSRVSRRSIRGTSRPISLYKTPLPRGNNEWNPPLPAQLSDLAALSQGRLYRDQELIWYVLDEPLRVTVPSRPEVDYTINLWPGVLRTVARPPPANRHGNAESPTVSYLVTIPSIQRTYCVPQTSIVPFQAYRPNENLLAELRSTEKKILLNEFDHGFDPLPRSSTLETPVSPETAIENSPLELFIMDVGITKQISHFWTATDDHLSPAPNAPDPTVPPSPSPSPSLQGSPQHAARPLTRNDSLPSCGPPNQGYRGLWWGAERVWVGDLLRLSFPGSQLDCVRANSSYFANEWSNSEEECVFLKLRALIPLRTERGNEMHATGYLYKLVPSPPDRLEPEGNLGLPRAPEGFAFEPMLSANIEAQFSVGLVKGRYYPRLLSFIDGKSVPEECRLKTMEGLSSIDSTVKGPVKYREGARKTTIDAVRSLILR